MLVARHIYPQSSKCRRLLSNRKNFSITAPAAVTSRGVMQTPGGRVEEEALPGFDSNDFFPINPGDVLSRRYEVLTKLGFGSWSTVWLARDRRRKWFWQPDRYVVIKVGVSQPDKPEMTSRELEISRHLRRSPDHPGFQFVRTMIDEFTLKSRCGRGIHPCLVYEPMRESISLYQRRFPEDTKVPITLLKVYVECLLKGLTYLHDECGIVHSDLKPDNIMMTIEDDEPILESFIKTTKAASAKPVKIVGGDYPVYTSHYDLGRVKKWRCFPKLADFGLAQLMPPPGADLPRWPIQPPAFHAPEVLLGTGWSCSADIWNLGVLIWNLLEGQDLFQNIGQDQGTYDGKRHMAEMIALLGQPPAVLSIREKTWGHTQFSASPMTNFQGKACWNAREYFGGPFFDDTGKFAYQDLVPPDVTLRNSITAIEGEDKEVFIDFVGQMLQWLPEDRKTAAQLLQHPWISG